MYYALVQKQKLPLHSFNTKRAHVAQSQKFTPAESEGRSPVLTVETTAEIKPKEPVKIKTQKYIQRTVLNAAEDVQRSVRQFLSS